ncbi:hypothetical protein SLEP1_g29072 [Rubroshorea leprosula]|uniref:HECT-type E3 ubiquitin transferase n=1 Tax=Rubroshorea leprosula TaxID=152421 RepID=A0AAV5JY95_9ROSI|nr:hypothetical protein SLEP1_g29072 [Rubroshorea leprosula]
MSLHHFSAVDPITNGHDPRLSTKRKFDDYAPTLDEDGDDSSLTHRMRKDDHHHHTNRPIDNLRSSPDGDASDLASDSFNYCASSSSAPSSSATCSSSRLQFFIRMISEGNTIVIHANSEDTVKSLHERIHVMTGIPVYEQRLIYRGKQLQWEQSLADCEIQNDAGLHLVGRMRSTNHPQAWQAIDDMISAIRRLCRGDLSPCNLQYVKDGVQKFFNLVPKDDNESATAHLQIFMVSSAPVFLVTLYMSPIDENRRCAETSIKLFLNSCKTSLSKHLHSYCTPMVLEFCKLLRKVVNEDKDKDKDKDNLYKFCRSTLGFLLESADSSTRGLKHGEQGEGLLVIQEIFPFVSELADRLCQDMKSSIGSAAGTGSGTGPSSNDVRDFSSFLSPLRTAINRAGFQAPKAIQSQKRGCEELDHLHAIFNNLMNNIDDCLARVEECLAVKVNGGAESAPCGWLQYLAILKELNGISKLYSGDEERFWMVLKHRKSALCALIVRFAKRIDDHRWILEHKEVIDFESRRHLAMMMFPDVKEDYDELHEMLIDRSNLLEESFEYIARAEPEALHAGLFMEFKNEEATGPGVLREWFFLVCQALFNPEIALFLPCPNDRRRFFPNPASKVNRLHLDYFRFAGRVIALALMHKVQLGVVFDRVFFLQLAKIPISLEDIREADPRLYGGLKQILEMEAEYIDSDALGLTFSWEVEELGSRKVIELLPGGKSIGVNSRNRQEYVDHLIEHQFVTSVSEQVEHFARGFADILSNSRDQKFFFQSLELEDLDWMLHGSENAICIEDWKAYTEYNGYRENDPQITWFWKIVGEMSAAQRQVLLFFWTSVKYLPIEGFCGFASKLYIYKSHEQQDRLPSSHTCFYRLCLPPYPSMAVMKNRLDVITQEHIGCSFGTW